MKATLPTPTLIGMECTPREFQLCSFMAILWSQSRFGADEPIASRESFEACAASVSKQLVIEKLWDQVRRVRHIC